MYSNSPTPSEKHAVFASTNQVSAMLDDLDDTAEEAWERTVHEKDHVDVFSMRGWMNIGALILIVAGLIGVFCVLPVTTQMASDRREQGRIAEGGINGWSYNLGGVNATGQRPAQPRELIDPDTPLEVYTRTGFDGKQWSLKFSDEFNVEGRTFFPGDDPFWEAVDLHYHGTGDWEWYDPSTCERHQEDRVLIFCRRGTYRGWIAHYYADDGADPWPEFQVGNVAGMEQGVLLRVHVL
jgi:hypothetical protein